MKAALLIGIAAFGLLGCNKPQSNRAPLNMDEIRNLIVGSYWGSYAKGREYFEIKPDGTFMQTFVQDKTTNYVFEGKWSVKKFQDCYWITLDPFMDLRDTIAEEKSPKRGGRVATFYEDEPKIWFNSDLNYFITKRINKAAN